jgi:flavin reductase (DIM6/NTAB) family NADH-FMN oxidoreductase RutF
VQPPRVAESPIAMECKLFQVVAHGAGPVAANYVIGEVLCFHIAEDAAHSPKASWTTSSPTTSGAWANRWYVRATPEAMFRLERPTGK